MENSFLYRQIQVQSFQSEEQNCETNGKRKAAVQLRCSHSQEGSGFVLVWDCTTQQKCINII